MFICRLLSFVHSKSKINKACKKKWPERWNYALQSSVWWALKTDWRKGSLPPNKKAEAPNQLECPPLSPFFFFVAGKSVKWLIVIAERWSIRQKNYTLASCRLYSFLSCNSPCWLGNPSYRGYCVLLGAGGCPCRENTVISANGYSRWRKLQGRNLTCWFYPIDAWINLGKIKLPIDGTNIGWTSRGFVPSGRLKLDRYTL